MKKRHNIFKKNIIRSVLLIAGLSVAAAGTISCSKDENNTETTFSITDLPNTLEVSSSGIKKGLTAEQSYIVRSNAKWAIESQTDDDWARFFPMEGDRDGIIRISVDENTSLEARSMSFAFISEETERPVLFTVKQKASEPFIRIGTGNKSEYTIPRVGGSLDLGVSSNIDWDYTIEDNSFLTINGITSDSIKVSADQINKDGEYWSALLTLTGKGEYSDIRTQIRITQLGALIYQDFSWLNYGSALQWETTGETRWDNWTASEQANTGWTSGTEIVYARQGFIKLGKTSYGGDIVSPELGISGTEDIEVVFKATPYISSKGTKDLNTLYVGVIGDGELETEEDQNSSIVSAEYDGTRYSCIAFTIDNYPNPKEESSAVSVWAPEVSQRRFKIKNAKASTKVFFMGGAYGNALGTGIKNRIFLDDIKILELE
ncbi:MAG: hypothetical protein LKI53_07980 [Bacteroidales bacterium]|jgi:hypothetical protein|nr:hypothetical protein [Bacteroidales bacterium]